MTGHTPWSEIVHKRRRWVHAGFADCYTDTLGMYAPVSAIEIHARIYRRLANRMTATQTDVLCIYIAQTRTHRCRPWKIAR